MGIKFSDKFFLDTLITLRRPCGTRNAAVVTKAIRRSSTCSFASLVGPSGTQSAVSSAQADAVLPSQEAATLLYIPDQAKIVNKFFLEVVIPPTGPCGTLKAAVVRKSIRQCESC